MLIRSQDKNTLTRFYKINIVPHIKMQYDCDIEPPEPMKDEKWVVYAIQSEHTYEMIGEYSTQAKAMRVLDMIQDWVIKTKREEICYYVFYMPADEEVQIC